MKFARFTFMEATSMQRAELQTLADGEQTLQVLQRMVALSGTGRRRVQRAQHV